jgi:hypothetical protein
MNPLGIGAGVFLVMVAIIAFVALLIDGFADGPAPRDQYFWPNTYSHWYAGLRGKAQTLQSRVFD